MIKILSEFKRRQVLKMNAEMNFERKSVMEENKEMGIVSENCNCSIFSMATAVAGTLMVIGAVVYAIATL